MRIHDRGLFQEGFIYSFVVAALEETLRRGHRQLEPSCMQGTLRSRATAHQDVDYDAFMHYFSAYNHTCDTCGLCRVSRCDD